MQADSCPEHQCDDPTHETPVVVPPLPSPSGGGGHEFVTELPEIGTPGVEYILMGDPRDCSSFKGSYVWNNDCWVATSGAGGGALDTYTFEKTTTGWVAKKNGKVIFTYNDERITQLITDVTNIDNRVTNVEGDVANINTRVTTNTTNININKNDITNIKNDIYGDYLKNRIAVCEDSPLTLSVDETNPQAKKIILCMDETKVGDKSDGAYQIKGQLSTYLSTSLLGTTPVNIVNVPDLDPTDIVLGETYLYDNQGTMGVVKAYNKTTGIMTVTTMTTSPGERSGVRLGSVELVTDLPATITAAEGLGWLTPVEGDFAYVRDDDGKLAEYLVQSIDGSGNITWVFSHYINAGNYVVDILTDKGVLIPKNPDGTVTLPVNDRIKTIYLADGTALPVDANYAVTLPDFIKGAVLKDGTVLPVNANKQIVLPDFGTLKGVMTHDGTDLVIDTNGKVTLPRYVKGIKDSDGNLLTMDVDDVITLPAPTEKYDNYEIDLSTKDIATDIDANITIPVADITSILKKGATMTTADFNTDVTPNRDLIFIHGLDGTDKTQEAIAYYVSGDANNLVFRVLAIPKAGSGGGASDKEVPEYTRDLHAGDVINHLELITYDNILYRMIDTAPYTLTGTWSTDKTHFEVINSEAKNTYYNINRDGQELLSAYGMLDASISFTATTDGQVMPFVKKSGTFNQPTAGVWTIPAHTRVEMIMTLAVGRTSTAGGMMDTTFAWYNNATGAVIPELAQFNQVIQDSVANPPRLHRSGTQSWQFENNTDAPIDIVMKQVECVNSQYIDPTYSSFCIKEIGRIVDPIAYLNSDGNAEDTPVGNIISYMGNNVPKHYLACDGAEYAIGTYPELEAHFIKEFGSVTYFGAGSATNTYKIPDLQGEFLRGTGTNSHANQGDGATVGEHQDATEHPISNSGAGFGVMRSVYSSYLANTDKIISTTASSLGQSGNNQHFDDGKVYASRPTNTSVKYCIKYETVPKIVIEAGIYKTSCPATVAATGTETTFTLDEANAVDDTSMIDSANNSFVIPETGYYAITMDIPATMMVTTGNSIPNDATYVYKMKKDGLEFISDRGAMVVSLNNNGYWSKTITYVRKMTIGDVLEPSINFNSLDNPTTSPIPANFTITMVNCSDRDTSQIMLKPNLWTPGVEQSFGDGVYGKRIKGTMTLATALAATGTTSFGVSGVKSIISQGGIAARGDSNYIGMGVGGAFNEFNAAVWLKRNNKDLELWLARPRDTSNNTISSTFSSTVAYDVWVLYTK